MLDGIKPKRASGSCSKIRAFYFVRSLNSWSRQATPYPEVSTSDIATTLVKYKNKSQLARKLTTESAPVFHASLHTGKSGIPGPLSYGQDHLRLWTLDYRVCLVSTPQQSCRVTIVRVFSGDRTKTTAQHGSSRLSNKRVYTMAATALRDDTQASEFVTRSLARGLTSSGEQSGRSSALSSKITSILSASYADIEIRDALETLDTRHVQNTAETRRSLRRDVQKEMINANAEIIHDFGQVAEQLKTVGVALHNLQQTVASIRKHVVSARTETKPLLDEANQLVAQKSQVDTKRRVLSAFSAHFTLSDEEIKCLTSGGEPVNDAFFAALVSAKRIHRDSQHLLGGENQRLGLEVLDQSTNNLNSAFQKLFRFLQREFKNLDLENPRITASIRRALRVLAERPTLFQNCLDTFAESRERTLAEAFYAALTGSNHAGRDQQKPIDFSAHEPLRYVGDMLAWAHSTAVSEREALEGLFISEGDEIARGINEGLEIEPWSRREDSSTNDENGAFIDDPKLKPGDIFDGRRALSQLVNRSLAGVAHLLVQRIDTVINSHDDPVLAYKIANLIVFYRSIFSRLVNESGFLDTLDKINGSALDRFKTTMRNSISALQNDTDATTSDDLDPPSFLEQALENLTALLKSFETSLTTGAAPNTLSEPTTETDTPPGLQLIYTEALDPYLNLLLDLGSTQPNPTARTIFQLNSLHVVIPTLAPFKPLTTPKLNALTTELTTLQATLVTETHTFLLHTSGLNPLLSASSLPNAHTSAAFKPEHLSAVSEQIDAFLPNAVMDAEARLGTLREKSMVEGVVREAGSLFVADFERVEDVVLRIEEGMAERGGEGDRDEDEMEGLRSVFPRTAEEVRVLLS